MKPFKQSAKVTAGLNAAKDIGADSVGAGSNHGANCDAVKTGCRWCPRAIATFSITHMSAKVKLNSADDNFKEIDLNRRDHFVFQGD